MTITATNAFTGPYTGDGSTTAFPFNCQVKSSSEVAVYVNGAVQSVGFTVALNADGSGTVTFTTAPAVGVSILIASSPSFSQDIGFTDGGPFLESNVDDANDRAAIRDIYLKGITDRAVLSPVGEAGQSLPPRSALIGQFLVGDASGNLSTASGTGADATLRADVAASSGSGLVGFIGTAAAAVARTVRDKLRERVTPYDFGAVGDGVTDDTAALVAFNTWFFGDGSVIQNARADFSGNFAVSGTINLGPTSPPATNAKRWNMGGDFRLIQLTDNTTVTCAFRNLDSGVWQGRVTLQGRGSSTFASRTCAIGGTFTQCPLLRFTAGLRAFNFWYRGFWFPSTGSSNDEMHLGTVRVYDCGSGVNATGYSETSNWSAPLNSGTSASTAQRTQLTLDVLPSSVIDTYQTIGSTPLFVNIAGYPYFVYGIDRVANTISIYPWLDNTSVAAGSGTLRWIFGGALGFAGSDSNIINIDHLQAINCGIGYEGGALYGQRISSTNFNSCGIAAVIGSAPINAEIGTSGDNLYFESNNDINLVLLATPGTNCQNYITSTSGSMNFAKCFSVSGPRVTAGNLVNDAFGSGQGSGDVRTNGLLIAEGGYLHTFHKRSLTNPLTNAMTFREHSRPPRILEQNVNTQTVTLTVQGSGEWNRLFGYNGGNLLYTGSGVNGAPTGSFPFAPPSGGTVNGGATNATVTFSGFDGPALFRVYHTDTAQLTWVVKPVTGLSRVGLTGTATNGDTSVTLTPYTDKVTQRFTTTLTADRTVTLATAGAVEGNRFRIVRPASGAFNLNVGAGPLKALAASTWCEVEYDGAAWNLVSYGSM